MEFDGNDIADTRLEDPKKALEQFKKVVELSSSVSHLEDETLNL